MSIKGMYIK